MQKKGVNTFWGYLFIFPQLAGLLVFALLPLVMAVVLAFMKWDGFGAKVFVGFANFAYTFKDPDFLIALKNTTFYTVMVVPGTIIFGILIAVGLNKVRGKMLYRIFYYMPSITSSVAVAVVFLWIFNSDFGLINVYLKQWFHIQGPKWLTDTHIVLPSIALLSIWWGVGGNMILFLAGLQGISASYYEAAQIDGASKLQQFRHITIPLLTPTTFFATIVSIIGSFQVFDQSFIMTGGGPSKASYTLVYHIYQRAFVDFTFGRSAAGAIVLFVIILLLTAIQLRMGRRWVHYEG
ncbi:carbohydrate ABC transporter permease [Paenibacillus humicola]|uniref:carbohydrate ABC transporter permease n=1 Tax=Paenibacillus humicola TaxID=3110540 RepID=UPI00237BFB0C|nr:sugar ABC transporter permease [Paenibacillus humicola]